MAENDPGAFLRGHAVGREDDFEEPLRTGEDESVGSVFLGVLILNDDPEDGDHLEDFFRGVTWERLPRREQRHRNHIEAIQQVD